MNFHAPSIRVNKNSSHCKNSVSTPNAEECLIHLSSLQNKVIYDPLNFFSMIFNKNGGFIGSEQCDL